MVSTISLAENDDSEAYDSVLQISHLVGSNRGQLELHRKSFKSDYDGKHQETRSKFKDVLNFFSKLRIF